MAPYNKGIRFIIHYDPSRKIKAYHHKNDRGVKNTPDLCTVVISVVLTIKNVHTTMLEGGFVFAFSCRFKGFGKILQASNFCKICFAITKSEISVMFINY